MNDAPPEYRVGYKRPPLHRRFRKGQSGNPEGGRRRKRHDRHLLALIEAALDARTASGGRPPATRREAVIVGLVEKSATGDLGATKLLLNLMLRSEVAAPPPAADAENARAVLLGKLARLAAAPASDDRSGPAPRRADAMPATDE